LNQTSIFEAIGCERVHNYYYPKWEAIYVYTRVIEKKLYDKNCSSHLIDKKIEYKKLCPKVKI